MRYLTDKEMKKWTGKPKPRFKSDWKKYLKTHRKKV